MEVVTIEGTGDVGYILETYINEDPPDLLVLGSSNKEGLQK
jgi:hypothetical protein